MASESNGSATAEGVTARERLEKIKTAFRETLDFPEEYMAPAYRHGVALYNHGHYDEASQVFRFLAACDVANPRLWKALGAAHKMAGRHDEAVAAFGLAVNTGSTDPWIPVYAAECLMHLQRIPEAVAALDHAAMIIDVAGDEAPAVRRRLRALLEGVERSLAA